MSDRAVPREVLPESLEAGSLARELTAAFCSMVEYEKEQLRRKAPEALQKAEESAYPEYEKKILNRPADQVTWFDLEYLGERNPELATQCWQTIKRAALDDLQSGHRASRVMEGYHSDAWMRAQFLALRRDLTSAWQPRDGLERQLIDAMAQAQTAMFFWQERLSLRASFKPMQEKLDIEKRGGWNPPRMSDAQAVDQAAAMVDRFNKMFLRTLRALRDLRRYSPTVVVQNAEQVNVGREQVNVKCDTGG
jgi:hypothetical protein